MTSCHESSCVQQSHKRPAAAQCGGGWFYCWKRDKAPLVCLRRCSEHWPSCLLSFGRDSTRQPYYTHHPSVSCIFTSSSGEMSPYGSAPKWSECTELWRWAQQSKKGSLDWSLVLLRSDPGTAVYLTQELPPQELRKHFHRTDVQLVILLTTDDNASWLLGQTPFAKAV